MNKSIIVFALLNLAIQIYCDNKIGIVPVQKFEDIKTETNILYTRNDFLSKKNQTKQNETFSIIDQKKNRKILVKRNSNVENLTNYQNSMEMNEKVSMKPYEQVSLLSKDFKINEPTMAWPLHKHHHMNETERSRSAPQAKQIDPYYVNERNYMNNIITKHNREADDVFNITLGTHLIIDDESKEHREGELNSNEIVKNEFIIPESEVEHNVMAKRVFTTASVETVETNTHGTSIDKNTTECQQQVVDPVKSIKLKILKMIENYNTKEYSTMLFKLNNFQVQLIKKSNNKDKEEHVNEEAEHKGGRGNQLEDWSDVQVSDEKLNELLIENLANTIESYQLNMAFANSSSQDEPDGVINKLVSFEGRKKKKDGGHAGFGLAMAAAMCTAGLMFIKMVAMKAMALSLLSLALSIANKGGGGGGGHKGRQIEAKYTDLSQPLCNCKCPGDRQNAGYKFYNDHKNAIITLDANGDEIEQHHDGSEYLPQLAYKNIYLPGPALGSIRYEK